MRRRSRRCRARGPPTSRWSRSATCVCGSRSPLGSCREPSVMSTPSTASTSRSRPARPWAWSASPAAASRRWAGRTRECSGGQRKRMGTARALAVEPTFIVCDEPISALDVSIQAQIINLLENLQSKFKLTYLFIAHDLSVVKHISNRIAVMYLGKVMEVAPASQLYRRPRHPYTGSLMSAIPIPDPAVWLSVQRFILQGDVASPVNPPSGCRFRTRCPRAREHCAEETPPLEAFGSDQWAACFYPLD